MSAKAYTRIGKFSISDVLDHVPPFTAKLIGSVVKEYLGKLVNMESHRYYCFLHSGIACVSCGLKASFFGLETHKKQKTENFHFNLYGINEAGEEILFTKDHIIAKKNGGKNHPVNYQTMCEECNRNKGHSRHVRLEKLPNSIKIWIDGELDSEVPDNKIDIEVLKNILNSLGHWVHT